MQKETDHQRRTKEKEGLDDWEMAERTRQDGAWKLSGDFDELVFQRSRELSGAPERRNSSKSKDGLLWGWKWGRLLNQTQEDFWGTKLQIRRWWVLVLLQKWKPDGWFWVSYSFSAQLNSQSYYQGQGRDRKEYQACLPPKIIKLE